MKRNSNREKNFPPSSPFLFLSLSLSLSLSLLILSFNHSREIRTRIRVPKFSACLPFWTDVKTDKKKKKKIALPKKWQKKMLTWVYKTRNELVLPPAKNNYAGDINEDDYDDEGNDDDGDNEGRIKTKKAE